jgi:hypothetical protein
VHAFLRPHFLNHTASFTSAICIASHIPIPALARSACVHPLPPPSLPVPAFAKFPLFHDAQTDFPIVYTSAINRQSGNEPDSVTDSMIPLFEQILKLPAPNADIEGSLQVGA